MRPRRVPAAGAGRRLLHRHRRPVAAVLVGLAGALTVHALAPAPDGVAVTVAARDLTGGHEVIAADLTTTLLPPGSVPDGLLAADDLVGARLASPVRRGEPVTDVRVGGAGLVSSLPSGHVAVPVRLVAQAEPWLAVGQRLRLRPADPLAPGGEVEVVVLDLDRPADGGGGVLGPVGAGESPVGALVQVASRDGDALAAGSAEPMLAVLVGG